jgi:protein-S-isoprenylcysteine O-methyltransferase Ste14
MDTERDGAAVRFPPPLLYVGALLLGGLWHVWVAPLPLRLSLGLRVALTVATAAAGIAMIAAALGLFRRTGQDPKPWESTPQIISTGIYRWTRNPMYVGMALIQASIGIGWGNAWLLLLLPVVLVLVYVIAVRHEEAYLERKFGDGYLHYRRSVRRWL